MRDKDIQKIVAALKEAKRIASAYGSADYNAGVDDAARRIADELHLSRERGFNRGKFLSQVGVTERE